MSSYKPTEIDIEWLKTVTGMIKNGGMLAYPSTQLVYRVWHQKHELELVNPSILLSRDSHETHLRTINVLKVMGWKMKEREGNL
jgi:hypothetical protein